MNRMMTESDKKLLAFLAAFLIAAGFFFFAFKPLTDKNRQLQKEINSAREQLHEMDKKAVLAQDMAEAEQAAREKTDQVLKRFYPLLESQNAESMITTLLLNHSLQIQSLTITMPETPVHLKWYQYSDQATSQSEETLQQDTEQAFAVYSAKITVAAEGSKRNLESLIDDLSFHYPAISITGAEWSVKDEAHQLTMNVEIYMCEQ